MTQNVPPSFSTIIIVYFAQKVKYQHAFLFFLAFYYKYCFNKNTLKKGSETWQEA